MHPLCDVHCSPSHVCVVVPPASVQAWRFAADLISSSCIPIDSHAATAASRVRLLPEAPLKHHWKPSLSTNAKPESLDPHWIGGGEGGDGGRCGGAGGSGGDGGEEGGEVGLKHHSSV